MLKLCDAAVANSTLTKRFREAGRDDDLFWVKASKVEALLGLGRRAESDALKAEIIGTQPPPPQWMIDTLNDQLAKLTALNP